MQRPAIIVIRPVSLETNENSFNQIVAKSSDCAAIKVVKVKVYHESDHTKVEDIYASLDDLNSAYFIT